MARRSEQKKTATPLNLTKFQLISSVVSEGSPGVVSLYPIHFFKAKVDSERALNTLIRAFDKKAGSTKTEFETGMSMSYHQPETFSDKILGQRLSKATLRLSLKLRKIN